MEEGFLDLVKKSAIFETIVDILLCSVPLWLAVVIGLVIGWSWRSRWTGLVYLGVRSKLRFIWKASMWFGAWRLWLAFTALSAFSVCRTLWAVFSGKGPGSAASASTADGRGNNIAPNIGNSETDQHIVTENDLEHLLHFLDKNGEMTWKSIMERSTFNLTYQAWCHEPETGPIVYRSRTVFDDASPELVRDFFWDDDFRSKWDPMLSYFKILVEFPQTGTMIVHWIKKFPFFCSAREYIIGRRIWEAGQMYYCVTKGVPYPVLQRSDKLMRVNLYFSSWVIKPVQTHEGQPSACEVTLVHYEDMGIAKDVAKLGVRHGMWGTVKKLHSGFRVYQDARISEASLSRSSLMARITTRISLDGTGEEESGQTEAFQRNKDHAGIDLKWMVIGGTVALLFGLQTGVIAKTLFLGVGQRVARR
ncbi:uncharacterized protein LOC132296612 [Cornus florida]|uniref:uncharacterized protein LOC132296612 n=1 Tax=Cornus florida TaxID=4283 RepID=UPI00289655F4|nr:uncharacterized protein LOC132296612 [Cornus florida]